MKNNYEIRGTTTAIIMKPKRGDIIETIIDTNMLQSVEQIPYSWFIVGSRKNNPDSLYAGACIEGKLILLHRLLTNTPHGMVVDHINHNTFDNRLCNLRVVSLKENQHNRKTNKDNKSGVPGVWREKGCSTWRASLKKDGKTIHLGSFHDINDAEKAVIEARKIHLPFSMGI